MPEQEIKPTKAKLEITFSRITPNNPVPTREETVTLFSEATTNCYETYAKFLREQHDTITSGVIHVTYL